MIVPIFPASRIHAGRLPWVWSQSRICKNSRLCGLHNKKLSQEYKQNNNSMEPKPFCLSLPIVFHAVQRNTSFGDKLLLSLPFAASLFKLIAEINIYSFFFLKRGCCFPKIHRKSHCVSRRMIYRKPISPARGWIKLRISVCLSLTEI